MTGKVKLGVVGFTDKGIWQEGYTFTQASTGAVVTGYNLNDIVHTTAGAYRSKVSKNTSNPDEDAENWQTWLDLRPSKQAIENENERQASEAERAKAEESRQTNEGNRADAEKLRTQTEANRNEREVTREQAETERIANETTRAEGFQTLYDSLQAKSAELDRLIAAVQQQGSIAPMSSIPASIAIIDERTILAGATINVSPTDVQPTTANRSMIYQIYSGEAQVDAQGNVKTTTAGDILIKVIPTLSSGAARLITIHAKNAEALKDDGGTSITDENDNEIFC